MAADQVLGPVVIPGEEVLFAGYAMLRKRPGIGLGLQVLLRGDDLPLAKKRAEACGPLIIRSAGAAAWRGSSSACCH
ncbi:MAG: hypothetical protein CMJ75_02275 [Planctomycetaceae bacterium]|nr:hypothetical protein [Planctomycetaceae bacterium]